MASRRTHISTMIHNRSVSNVCSLILVWRRRQRHSERTAASFVPRTQHVWRLQMDGSDEQQPIRRHWGYSYLNNACPYWYYIHLSAEKSNYLQLNDNNNSLINDNSYIENKKSFPWGMATFASSLISPQADYVSLHLLNKPLSGWKVGNVVFIKVIVNLLTSISSTWTTVSFNFEIFCFPVPQVWKKEAINSGIKAVQIKKWHEHLQLWQSCAI